MNSQILEQDENSYSQEESIVRFEIAQNGGNLPQNNNPKQFQPQCNDVSDQSDIEEEEKKQTQNDGSPNQNLLHNQQESNHVQQFQELEQTVHITSSSGSSEKLPNFQSDNQQTQNVNRNDSIFSIDFYKYWIAKALVFFGLKDQHSLRDNHIDPNQLLKDLLAQYYVVASSRKVEPQFRDYVGERIDKDQYLKIYKGDKKQRLQKTFSEANITGYRRVRGDGNCFYTSFGFNLLEQFSPQRINNLIEETNLKPLNVKGELQPNIYSQKDVEMIRQYLIFKLDIQKEKLPELFQAKDPLFYFCFQIFIRNLVYESLQLFKTSGHEQVSQTEILDPQEILHFEQESPNATQLIVCFLAIQLKMQITLVSEWFAQCYGEFNQNGSIKILFNPGHFEILY